MSEFSTFNIQSIIPTYFTNNGSHTGIFLVKQLVFRSKIVISNHLKKNCLEVPEDFVSRERDALVPI
jgi:hypothetical protein